MPTSHGVNFNPKLTGTQARHPQIRQPKSAFTTITIYQSDAEQVSCDTSIQKPRAIKAELDKKIHEKVSSRQSRSLKPMPTSQPLNFNPKVAGNQGRDQEMHQSKSAFTTITICQSDAEQVSRGTSIQKSGVIKGEVNKYINRKVPSQQSRFLKPMGTSRSMTVNPKVPSNKHHLSGRCRQVNSRNSIDNCRAIKRDFSQKVPSQQSRSLKPMPKTQLLNFNPNLAGNQGRRPQIDDPKVPSQQSRSPNQMPTSQLLNFNPKVAVNQARAQQIPEPTSVLTTVTISQADADNSVAEFQSKAGGK
jgi:hypothetical protein